MTNKFIPRTSLLSRAILCAMPLALLASCSDDDPKPENEIVPDVPVKVDTKPVDMGLSVQWAPYNVGASLPEECGSYFAWGEIEAKDTYSWSTYKYGSSSDALTKYCTYSDYGKNGFTDDKTVLDKEDDAAAANWGGNWRMPTIEEYQELLNSDYCIWEWTTQSGVNGYLVTSKITGASLFLPAAGCRYDSDLDKAGSGGYYWSASLGSGDPYDARYLLFYSGYQNTGYDYRYYGHTVRPVCP